MCRKFTDTAILWSSHRIPFRIAKLSFTGPFSTGVGDHQGSLWCCIFSFPFLLIFPTTPTQVHHITPSPSYLLRSTKLLFLANNGANFSHICADTLKSNTAASLIDGGSDVAITTWALSFSCILFFFLTCFDGGTNLRVRENLTCAHEHWHCSIGANISLFVIRNFWDFLYRSCFL